MVIIPYPPYLPDLDPCDFALFPKLKIKLRGQHFETVSNIQGKVLRRVTSMVLLKRGGKKIMGLLYTFPRRLL
jgi:hypothetical protein